MRDSHLNRCSTLPTWIKLTDTPRCVPHILTGNVCSIETRCLRQNKSATYLWQTATQSNLNCSRVHNSSQTAKQITVVFTRIKPLDMSCSKNENSCKTHDSWQQTTKTRFHKSKFCPVRNRPKLWNFKTSQNIAPFQSELDSSFKAAFAFLLAAVWWLPSLALPPGLVPLKNLYM